MGEVVPIKPPDDAWLAFRAIYPRREAWKDAAKAWKGVNPADYPAVLEGLQAWCRVWRLQNRSTVYIPLPATFLRGDRWTDEIPVEFRQADRVERPRTNANPEPRCLEPKGEIPPYVRDLVAKMKQWP